MDKKLQTGSLWRRFTQHMQYNVPEIGWYRSLRLAAALAYGELRDRISPDHTKQRQERLNFDDEHNVQTAERKFIGDMDGAPLEARRQAIRYEPITSELVLAPLELLEVDLREFTLIDIGAGKGKVLFLAAYKPFKRLIGIEFDEGLANDAEQNIKTYTNPKQQCTDLSIVNTDAREYILPEGPLVLFFHFPFRAPLLKEVLEQFGPRLSNSFLIWVTLENEEAEVLDARPELSRYNEVHECVIYRGMDVQLQTI